MKMDRILKIDKMNTSHLIKSFLTVLIITNDEIRKDKNSYIKVVYKGDKIDCDNSILDEKATRKIKVNDHIVERLSNCVLKEGFYNDIHNLSKILELMVEKPMGFPVYKFDLLMEIIELNINNGYLEETDVNDVVTKENYCKLKKVYLDKKNSYDEDDIIEIIDCLRNLGVSDNLLLQFEEHLKYSLAARKIDLEVSRNALGKFINHLYKINENLKKNGASYEVNYEQLNIENLIGNDSNKCKKLKSDVYLLQKAIFNILQFLTADEKEYNSVYVGELGWLVDFLRSATSKEILTYWESAETVLDYREMMYIVMGVVQKNITNGFLEDEYNYLIFLTYFTYETIDMDEIFKLVKKCFDNRKEIVAEVSWSEEQKREFNTKLLKAKRLRDICVWNFNSIKEFYLDKTYYLDIDNSIFKIVSICLQNMGVDRDIATSIRYSLKKRFDESILKQEEIRDKYIQKTPDEEKTNCEIVDKKSTLSNKGVVKELMGMINIDDIRPRRYLTIDERIRAVVLMKTLNWSNQDIIKVLNCCLDNVYSRTVCDVISLDKLFENERLRLIDDASNYSKELYDKFEEIIQWFDAYNETKDIDYYAEFRNGFRSFLNEFVMIMASKMLEQINETEQIRTLNHKSLKHKKDKKNGSDSNGN